jgi:nucleotide-binding universal stress UspA family protein
MAIAEVVMAIKTIIVGVDHSDSSDKALQRANQIALYHNAHLVIEYALDVRADSKLRGLLERVAREETEERLASLFGAKAASVETDVRVGRPFEVLRDVALERDADMIVLGVHRQAEGAAALSGSTARRLINVTPAPVLVAANETVDPYRETLVGFDDSPAAREALRFALNLAPAAEFNVISACMIPFAARRAEVELTRQMEGDTRRMIAEALRNHPLAVANADRIKTTVRAGEAFGVIMAALRAANPDLLVLGTSMPALYRQVFGGGIVDLIVADPPCDTLVVKT